MARTPDVRSIVHRLGFDDHADLILKSLRPAFRIKCAKPAKRPLPVGASKFGGLPDLPWDAPWPATERVTKDAPASRRPGIPRRPLHFLGQLRLRDVPQGHLPSGTLPEQGRLWIWADTIAWRLMIHGFDVQQFFMTYEPDESRGLERRAWPTYTVDPKLDMGGDEWAPFRECRIALTPMWTIDHAAEKHLSDWTWEHDRKRHEKVSDLVDAILGADERHGNHQLMGDIVEIQGPQVRMECECFSTGRPDLAFSPRDRRFKGAERASQEWRVLLVLDTDESGPGWMWGDAGRLIFCIRERDLAARKFESAWGALESS